MNTRDDISKHKDGMAGLLKELRSMNTVLDDSLSIGILVAFIHLANFTPITAAIKTLTDTHRFWEDARRYLFEECNALHMSPKMA